MLQDPAQDLVRVPGPGIQFFLAVCISIYPVFDPPEEHLHEDSLGAGPAAPYSSVSDSEQDDKDHQGDHSYEEDVEILGPELHTEYDKSPVEKIEQ